MVCVAALCLCACSKQLEKPSDSTAAKESAPTFIQYNILKGSQYCDKNSFTPIKLNKLSFKVKFDSSAIYTTSKRENQSDINKLFGFSDNNEMHHEYSARFGWRWSDGALRLFAYVYNNGAMSFKELGSVAIASVNTCSIEVAGDNYIFKLNDHGTTMPRQSTTAEAIGYRLYPYFGGDEPAPHDISIWIEQL